MKQSKKHEKIKYEWYEFLDIETLDYFSGQLLYCSDTYMVGEAIILKYNEKAYNEFIYFSKKIVWSKHSETTAQSDE